MLELIQFPWSPYCCVQRRILEFAGVAFKIMNIPPSDRSLVWKLTRKRYHQVPVIRNGLTTVFETDAESQVVAKYLEAELNLGLFPPEWDGVQRLLWRYIENEVEECTFKLNDSYYQEFVPPAEQLPYLRWKERKFGAGCLDRWVQERAALVAELQRRLMPFERSLVHRDFLLSDRPLFVDFDLWGMMANYLFSGHFRVPRALPKVNQWYRRLSELKKS